MQTPTAPLLYSDKFIAKKTWLRLALFSMLWGLSSWIIRVVASDDSWWLHGAWCIGMALIVAPVLRLAYVNGIAAAISDHKVMLSCTYFFYFVIGSSLYAFASQETIEISQGLYVINAREVLWVNGFNAIGFGIAVFAGTFFKGEWLLGGVKRCANWMDRFPIHLVILTFVVLGVFGVSVTLARDLGFSVVTVPGVFNMLPNLLLFAILLGTAYKGAWSRFILPIAVFGSLLMSFSGFLLFNKTNTFLPLLSMLAGLSLRFNSKMILLVGILCIALIFRLIGGVSSYGRINTPPEGLTFSERAQLMDDYFFGETPITLPEYSTWGRLSYTMPQVAAINFYDQGVGGKGLSLIPWLFVPRFVAPNKPVITATGNEFNYQITGNYKSATGQGVFVSGYYQSGFFGFLFASIFAGWFLAQTSAICKTLVARDAFALMPIGLLGLLAAYRIDGDIIADYIGSFAVILYITIFLILIFGVRVQRANRI
jgi:hypothetical protein